MKEENFKYLSRKVWYLENSLVFFKLISCETINENSKEVPKND